MLGNLILETFDNLMLSFSNNFGNLLIAVLLLVVGWAVGKIVETILKKALNAVKVDKYFNIGGDIKMSIVVPTAVMWIIYLIFIQAALAELGVSVLMEYFGRVVELIQNLLGGFLILVVGYFIARYAQKYFAKRKHEFSRPLSQGVFFFTMVITLSIAFDVIGLSTTLINNIILLIVASFGLGIALAIGFGFRDTVKRFAEKYEREHLKKS